MENILGFPASTIYDKPVQKVAFYKHMEMNSKMKQHFVDDVAEMNWLYKLAPSTLNVSDGKRVHEIVVFVVRLKAKDCLYLHRQDDAKIRLVCIGIRG